MESQKSSEGVVGMIVAAHSAVKSGLASTWNAVTKDGTIAAAMRQGADEIGMALKAFPDSIHVEEPGTILNPTQGEIASARGQAPSPSTATSPSAIAKDGAASVYGPDQGQAKSPSSPSPSEIAREQATTTQDAQPRGQEQSQPSPGDIARERGDVLTQEKTFAERELERRAKANQEGNADDQNERAKGRSLPEEQREKEKILGPSRCR